MPTPRKSPQMYEREAVIVRAAPGAEKGQCTDQEPGQVKDVSSSSGAAEENEINGGGAGEGQPRHKRLQGVHHEASFRRSRWMRSRRSCRSSSSRSSLR